MEILLLLLKIYLIIGFIYASYIFVNRLNRWYMFLIDILVGPLLLVYVVYAGVIKKRKVPF
ncbi:hypothetical protein A3K34_04375 [candidate division WWE3 bacterium RIFOXYC1_FULL_40_10]|uniref:Uncharacterized protein n=1 Tax=candidate division WWE3 bacterium RIFOXYA2_FULL_46_9 TaxID=1802636 RepID=A0A1F4W215_UNCKA|nr:MAG: hypothetical protein A3K58_04375 [candidate division WWE3 bacterium RIFOXYB1_FULL_40_22]OGC62078.1 MAG: hypothetical protein A3K37_04375 [candidate division WWE3 bacterium RIFOXYA1_FULL_40_11]OGC63093.1 MAG: hypothetical protein A2264_00120 [candidate division WWE3 bacterium RIFOXYA2_FULL_46_9]OGC64977.1 MAG: hypothetical protein A2326_02990 [candidate division WWE3 bacterium RIFOXYB2_FULL_41_6]OGC66461.1 MAG: hypothetical protein A3K34_04375 [candidate division WWE3 bacterium RIFOXYC1_